MHAAMPEKMLEVDKIAGALDARRFDIEFNSFGYNFADVGAELASRWKFPNEFATAIRAFPAPRATAGYRCAPVDRPDSVLCRARPKCGGHWRDPC